MDIGGRGPFRWNLDATDQLPEYLKLLYHAIYNNLHEINYIHLRARGYSAMHYLRKPFGNLCKAYMQKARWFYEGYVPSMDEYMKIAINTAAGFVLTLVSAVCMGDMVTEEAFDHIVNESKLSWLSCAVCRFTDDLGTSKGSNASITQRIEVLKEGVKDMLNRATDSRQKMNLVDTIDRLGLTYHFSEEIQAILQSLYEGGNLIDNDLHVVALRFRLLRRQGYYVPLDVFDKFKDKEGKFDQSLRNDIRGLLSLYEASHHGLPGENILDEALAFTTEHLKSMSTQLDPTLAKHVEHSLELPLHRRLPRLDNRYYISFYEETGETNHSILELAKLDFNLVQSLHQSEIKEVSRWWKDMNLAVMFPFARDHVVECYTWGAFVNYLPQFSYGRKALIKCISLISLTDDSFDIYGTLEELELFTEAIDRWNLEALDQLPEYLKLLYHAIYNSLHEINYIHLRTRGYSVMHYLRKSIGNLCKAYMQEAGWFYEGYVPSMDEYMKIATNTAGGFLIILVSAVCMGDMVTEEAFDYIVNESKLSWLSCAVCRLTDDLGTSKDEQERGDVAKSIQCYMKEHGVCEEEARMAIKNLNEETWKGINQELLRPIPFPKPLIEGALNFGRVGEMLYQHETDGHGSSQIWTKDRINLMYFEPVLL